ncbi:MULTISPECIES: SMP-30/gluconolactonase/LRE family protein [Bacillaceae]|uniref:Regucalcin n=1 Tax=Evansella alkalicola TaxID=745819 RepID=A0ABS6JPB1_9BACI|nr:MULTISPECIES: SMP-30/gluconolactonase/LRE family protein [Bacillaceae]MBU9720097.1 SMP-30/gluconolactonase/LRE family protein [Bacillus alkalicola]
MAELQLVVDQKATLGEGPCWDADQGVLYWVDIMKKRIHIFSPSKGVNETIQLEEYVGAVVVKEGEGLLVALTDGIYELDKKTDDITPVALPIGEDSDTRFNDGKCDPMGRFWAGTMHFDGDEHKGNLYCLMNNQELKKRIGGVTISNGLAWDVDLNKMYFNDSPTRNVYQFDYNSESGEITNQKVAIKIPKDAGIPDGMTIDNDGMLWVACWGGGHVLHCNPKTGEIVSKIEVPATNVTSCTFGGEKMDELYITTARLGISEEELKKEPNAGGLFRMKLNVKGAPSYKFKQI